ncbi:unnamed protein product [Rhizophagus irregularis]|nr:unnamed protein product [Rhizophagus irregularis]
MSNMDDNYRETMVKSLIITYWNRKTISKSLNSTSDKVKEFWKEIERIERDINVRREYRFSIDQHLREEKKHLSTIHLKELQEDDAISKNYDAEEENVSIEHYSDTDDDLDMAEINNNCSETNRKNSDDIEDFGDSVIPVNADTFIERLECQPSLGHTRRWILPSGTDVSEILEEYVKTVPENQKCLNPVYWGILDLTGNHPETKSLFSEKDWSDMVKNFEEEVKLSETTVSDAVCHFFDEIDEIIKKHEDPVMEIDKFSPEKIEESLFSCSTYSLTNT